MIKPSHLSNLSRLTIGTIVSTIVMAAVLPIACTTTQQTAALNYAKTVDGPALGVALNSLVGTNPSAAKVKATVNQFVTNPDTTQRLQEVNGVVQMLAPLAGPQGIADAALVNSGTQLLNGALPVVAGLTK